MSGRDAAILEHLGVAGGQLAEQRRAQAFVDGVRWVPLDHQVPPAWDWDTWLIVAGRGAGKTKTGAEMALEELEELGPDARIGIGAPTKADVRDYCAEGPSGLMHHRAPPFQEVQPLPSRGLSREGRLREVSRHRGPRSMAWS